MGIGIKTEHSMRREFANKLEDKLGDNYIILEEISIPKEYIIKLDKRKQIDLILLKKELTSSEGSVVKWQSGAVIAIIETKNPKLSAEKGVTQVLSYNQYFLSDFIFSTNYTELISIPSTEGKFAFEIKQFSDIDGLVKHIVDVISGSYYIEPYSLNLKALQALFQDIHGSFSTLFQKRKIEELEKIGFLYARNIDTETIKNEEDVETYQNSLLLTSAHILLTQLLFHRTLQQTAPRLGLNPLTKINRLSNLLDRFNEVLKIDYESIFALNVISLLDDDPNTITLINLVLKILNDFKIENTRQDLLGFLLQRLMPLSYRKKIAAYYTKIQPARLLADLTVDSPNQIVFDPACGSGGLLVASYHRRKNLDPNITHQEILTNTYGSDISPFACLLSTVNLALQAPLEFTSSCNIALSDSFELDHSKTLLDMVGLAKEIQLTSLKEINPVIKGFKLPRVDVLIANPPFTRGDRMSSEYKKYLSRKFSGWGFNIKELIDKKHLGLYGYFLLDIKRHLKGRGSFAFILPYSVLYTESLEPIFNFIRKNFGVKYIIKSEADPAFSDSTFEEIMLIGEKKFSGSMKIVVLKKPLENYSLKEVDFLAQSLEKEDKNTKNDEYRMIIVDQSELSDTKWTVFFHTENFYYIWKKIKDSTLPIHEVGETIRGNRVAPIDLFGLPNRNWEISQIKNDYVKVRSKTGKKIIFKFPSSSLFRSIKRYNEMAKYPAIIPKGAPEAFYINKIANNKIFKNWVFLNKSQQNKKMYPPIERLTHLAIPQKIGLITTRTVAFYSEQALHVGDGFMSIMMDSRYSFWYFCYLCSSFGLFNILVLLRVISGWYGQVLGPDMKFLRIPDISNAQEGIKEEIKKLVIVINKTPVKNRPTFLESIRDAKKNNNNPLNQLDMLLARQMGFNSEDVDNLYKTIILELERFEK